MSNDPAALGLRHRLGFLLKDSMLYGGAAAFNKAFALVTFPLLARHFSVEQYGVYDFLNVGLGLLAIIMVFGQDSAVARFFYDHPERRYRQQVISQSLAFQAGVLIVTMTPAWLLVGHIARSTGWPGVTDGLVRLMLAQIPFMVMINFSQNILKWTFSRAKFLTISLGSAMCSIIGLLVALLWFDVGFAGVFGVFLGARAAFGILGLWFCRGWLTWPEDWRFLRPMLLYAAPYGIICTASAFVPAMERTFIVRFLAERDLGLFAAGAKIAGLMALPIQAFQVAWGPFSLAIHKEQDAHVTYNQVLMAFTLGAFLLVMILAAIAEPAIRLLASGEYSGAWVVVFPMAMGLGLQGIFGIATIGISLSKRSYLHIYGYFVHLSVSALAIYGLVQFFGLLGVAWGAMLGRLAMGLSESWMSNRAYPLPWLLPRIMPCLVFILVWCSAGQAVTLHGGVAQGMVFNAIGAIAVVPFGALTLFSRSERNEAKAVVARRLGWSLFRS